MTITEVKPPANNQNSPSGWGRTKPTSCHYTRTYYQNGLVQQQWVACKCLDCDYCGQRKRDGDYQRALKQFSIENTIYLIYVPADEVDHLRKQAARRNHPIKSVPIAEDRNAVFSTHSFEGSHVPDDEEVRRLFLSTRISRRRLTDTGKWARKSRAEQPRPENRCTTLSKTFVGRQAFLNIAKRLKATVIERQDTIFFRDEWGYGPEKFKEMLVQEENRVRKARLKARGFGWARRYRDYAAA